MNNAELAKMLKEAGHPEEAEMVASVTVKDEARFEEWLSDPENKKRWDEALRKAKQ